MYRARVRPGCWLLVLLVCLACFSTAAPVQAAPPAQSRTPAFEPAPCTFDPPLDISAEMMGDRVECGYLTVPEEHANPDGATIRLAVAIVKSNAPNPAPDPLVMAQGGPGGSTIDVFLSFLLQENELAPDRDIVLFDQRGTLYTEPNLLCSEVIEQRIANLEEYLPVDQAYAREIDLLNECYTNLTDAGVNLSAYDSLENAADVDALRVALGYEQINLYGISYGSLLALHMMRDYPDGLRSVIIDAVVPAQINFVLETPGSQQRAFRRFFDSCANDPECNAAFPALEQDFYALVDQLNATPARVPMTDPETDITYAVPLDGIGLEDTLFFMLYQTDIIPLLPQIITDVQRGDYDLLSFILPLIVFDRTMSEGMYFSVICAEELRGEPLDPAATEQALDGLRPSIAEEGSRTFAFFEAVCGFWDVEPLNDLVNEPVVSDIPTLVLSGAFDPITPPDFGTMAAQTLPRSYRYVFPHTGHGAALRQPCPDAIVRAFLDDPTTAPDATCIESLSAPDYLTPDDLLRLPVLRQAARDEGFLIQVGVYAGGLLVLLSTLLVWPLALLIRLVRSSRDYDSPRPPTPGIARALRYIAPLNGLLLTGFLVGLIAWLIAVSDDTLIFLYGVPSSLAPLFLVPLVCDMLTLAMLVGAVLSWKNGFWAVWERFYFALLTLAALLCVALLGWWGVFWVWFV